MKLTAAVLIIGMAAATSWGQLGETPDHCDLRFGKSFLEKGQEGHWTLSRKYQQNDFIITVRFITLTTGAKVAGWISFVPTDPLKDTLAAREAFRQAASTAWMPVEETKLIPNKDAHTLEITKVHNQHVAEKQAIFRKVTGWNSTRCWMSPTAYAADNGTLILFSNAYLKRLDAGQDQATR